MRAFFSPFLPRRWTGALLSLVLLLGLCGQVAADPVDSTSRSPLPPQFAICRLPFAVCNSICRIEELHAANYSATLPVAASDWISNLMNKLETWLHDKTHMLQFCAIAMVIGLLIIWWRKT
jgi:hypothetical protein